MSTLRCLRVVTCWRWQTNHTRLSTSTPSKKLSLRTVLYQLLATNSKSNIPTDLSCKSKFQESHRPQTGTVRWDRGATDLWQDGRNRLHQHQKHRPATEINTAKLGGEEVRRCPFWGKWSVQNFVWTPRDMFSHATHSRLEVHCELRHHEESECCKLPERV